MKRSVITAMVLALFGFATIAQAEEKASPAGTWKHTVKARSGQLSEVTMKLKVDGEKLTGRVTVNDMDTEISNGKFKDGEVTFSVVREMNGTKRTTKYSGKLDQDSIKGKIEIERKNNQKLSNDWVATREKA